MQQPPPVPHLLARLEDFAARLAQTFVPTASSFPGEGDEGGETGEGERPSSPWRWRPAPDEWSLTEVSCHLRDVEREVHQARFRALLAEDTPFLPGVVSDAWAAEREYRAQEGPAALAEFLAARAQTLALLRGLDEAAWTRQGRHAFFGLTTMHELLHLVVKHDDTHWRQIEALLQSAPFAAA
jgi:hypothetical protein